MPPAKDENPVAIEMPLANVDPVTLTVEPNCVFVIPAPNELLADVMASLSVTIVLLIFTSDPTPGVPPGSISIPHHATVSWPHRFRFGYG